MRVASTFTKAGEEDVTQDGRDVHAAHARADGSHDRVERDRATGDAQPSDCEIAGSR